MLDDQLRTPEIDTIDPFGYGVPINFVLVNGPAAERVLSVPALSCVPGTPLLQAYSGFRDILPKVFKVVNITTRGTWL